jgi:hypothetical protein
MIEILLNRAGELEYGSIDMLYATIVGNLDDTFIRYKYSDGRGRAHTSPDPKYSPRRSF